VATTSPMPRVVADVVPSTLATNALLVVSGATLVGLMAQVRFYLPDNPVPITGQTFAVLLVAAALGSARGAMAMGLYAGFGVAGMPWFAGATAGFQFASFGYVMGFIAAAWVVGRLAERGLSRTPWGTATAMVIGSFIIYAIGATWLAVVFGLGWETAITKGVMPFLLGDVLKLALAAGLLPTAWLAISRLTRP
jgi:biotin transport system substrate-specific component